MPRARRTVVRTVSFELDVLPILSSRGCSAGACHGKQRGQNGFQLSLRSFDANFDFAAIVQEARGRRVFPASPDRSLLLRKATASLPHGGGQRIALNSSDYLVLRDWIAAGMPRRLPGEATLVRITIEPQRVTLVPNETDQLSVTAHYSDDTTRDVTNRTIFASNEAAIVSVDDQGRFRAGPLPGEATLMANYMYQLATCRTLIPLTDNVPQDRYAKLPRHNFIDEHVWKKLAALRLTPSEPAAEHHFLRRASIDIIGRIPSAEEARDFLADTSPSKREELVSRLLEMPEYAEHWANKWADLLRPNPYRVGIKTVLAYDNWIREQFRSNRPYDDFVRELVTARGSTWQTGATTFFRDRRTPEEQTVMICQLFLGIRLECAKCHHHPSEKWSQEDFYSLAAYFARIGKKGTGLSPPISGSEEIILIAAKGEVAHPSDW